MIESILIQAIFKWPQTIQDKESLKKLYHTAFTKIGEMLMDIMEHHEIPKQNLDYSMKKLALMKLRGGSLFEYWSKFKRYGFQQEVEKVIDAIWTIDKEIQEIIYKDLEIASKHIGFNFKYESNSWRKLFEAISLLDSKDTMGPTK
jgi:hypothetical protein